MAEMVKLGDVCKTHAGSVFPIEFQGKKSGKYPFFKVGDISKNVLSGNITIDCADNYIDDNIVGKLKASIVPENTVIFAKIGAALKLNRRILTTRPCLIDNNVIGISANEDAISPRYLYYYLKTIDMGFYSRETSIPSLKTSDILNIRFPLVSINEQNHIVKVLDTISTIIEKRKQQIAMLDELEKSLFIEMFGNPVKNPMGWDIRQLRDLSEKITCGNTPKGGKEVYVESGVMFFRSQNVWKNRLDLSDIAYIDERTHRKMKDSSLKHGDILITKTGRFNTDNSSLGRSALFLGDDDSANINGHVYLVRLCKDRILNRFVLQILISDDFKNLIRNVCVGGIDKRQLNKNHIEEFPIIVPPRELQNQFVRMIEYLDNKRKSLTTSLSYIHDIYHALMQEYFG